MMENPYGNSLSINVDLDQQTEGFLSTAGFFESDFQQQQQQQQQQNDIMGIARFSQRQKHSPSVDNLFSNRDGMFYICFLKLRNQCLSKCLK